jgi:hypothetical protein
MSQQVGGQTPFKMRRAPRASAAAHSHTRIRRQVTERRALIDAGQQDVDRLMQAGVHGK